MSRSEAIYRYTCNLCGKVSEQPTNVAPDNWLEVILKQKNASDITVHLCDTDTVAFKSKIKM